MIQRALILPRTPVVPLLAACLVLCVPVGLALAIAPVVGFLTGGLLVAVVVSWSRGRFLHLLVVVVLTELILGGSSRYYEFWETFTIRKLLFFIVWIVFIFMWGAGSRRNNFSLRSVPWARNALVIAVLTFAVFGLGLGLYRGNRPDYIIGDVQGFLYLSLAVPFCYFAQRERMKVEFLLASFAIPAAIYAAVKSIVYLGARFGYFSFSVVADFLTEDVNQKIALATSTGELRLNTVGDLFLMLGMPLFVAVAMTAKGGKRSAALVAITIDTLALAVSGSRGFWLGTLLTLGVLLATVASGYKAKLVAVVTVGFLGATLIFPSTTELVFERIELSFDLAEPSNILRLEQAPKLLRAGMEHPIFGRGFGATLPDLVRSYDAPYAFELQTLALFMKMGFVGCAIWLAFFAWLSWALLKTSRELRNPMQAMILRACLGGIVGLLFVGSTNPHLSTPTGMGFMALVVVTLDLVRQGDKTFSQIARNSSPSSVAGIVRKPRIYGDGILSAHR